MSAVYMSVAHVEDMIKKDEPVQKYYDLQEELGRGRFAVVKKCVSKESGETFAAKIIKKSRHGGRSGREQLLLEIDILHQSDHPKLVRLYDVFETRTEMILILEYAPGGDLHRHCIEGDIVRTEKEICYLIRQITEAVRYLHSKNVVHLDLKPDNILLKRAGQLFPEIRLIDFGLSRRVDVAYTQCDIVGTPEYVAPEVLAFEPLELGSDMWSVGVVTYVLLSGISPFAGDDVMETYANIGMVEYDFDCEEFDDVSDEAIDFIEKLLLRKPKERMTAREALEHAWLKQLEDGLSSADIVAALSAQSEGPPVDVDLSPLKVEDDVVSSASDDVSEVSEAFDDSISEMSECKSTEASESFGSRSSERLGETGSLGPVSSPERPSPIAEKGMVGDERAKAGPEVSSKSPQNGDFPSFNSSCSEPGGEPEICAKSSAGIAISASPELKILEDKSVIHKSMEDKSIEHKALDHKSMESRSVGCSNDEHEGVAHKSVEHKGVDLRSEGCKNIDRKSVDPKVSNASAVRPCDQNNEKKGIAGNHLKASDHSDVAKPVGSAKRSEPVEVPPRGKTPDKLGTDTSKSTRSSGKELVPGGIASKMASKFAHFQESFEKKTSIQKSPVTPIKGLKGNTTKAGEVKVSPSESPKLKSKAHSPVASPKIGSKFENCHGDSAKTGKMFELKETNKIVVSDGGKDVKGHLSDKFYVSKHPETKMLDGNSSEVSTPSKVASVLPVKTAESSSSKSFKKHDVNKTKDAAESKSMTTTHPSQVSQVSSAATGGCKSSSTVSTTFTGNIKLFGSPEESRRSPKASRTTEEESKSASPKTPVKPVSQSNISEVAGKGNSSPVMNGSVSRESSVTMKIGGPKFSIGPLVSAALPGKFEEHSVVAADGEPTAVSGAAGGTPMKVRMQGDSLKLSLDVSKTKAKEDSKSAEQMLLEAEESETLDEDGLREKKRAATLNEGVTWESDDSGDKSKSATLRESRKHSLLRREDSQRKNYRRLYVTKVRNSKIFDVDMSCTTETAEIKQRVENDVLKIQFVLKSTDLMLLPR